MSKDACLLPQNSNQSGRYLEAGESFLHLYNQDLKIKKCSLQGNVQVGGGIRKKIFQFSNSSRQRLLETCRNSGHLIKSQICLTYHTLSPINGKEVKRNLNQFLVLLRRHYSNVHYIWVLEFQANGHPHIHMFLSEEPTLKNREKIAKMWNMTTKESESNYKFTKHHKNFFKWNMRSGKYLSKEYITKSIQKKVPENFKNVGRFWGCSKSMVPRFVTIRPDKEIPESIYKKVVRSLTKNHEKIVRKHIHEARQKKKKTVNPNYIEPFKCDRPEAIEAEREKRRELKKKKKLKYNLRSKHQSYSLPSCATLFVCMVQNLIHQATTNSPVAWDSPLVHIFNGVPF